MKTDLQIIAQCVYFKRNCYATDPIWSVTVEADISDEKSVVAAFEYALANHPEPNDTRKPTQYKIYGLIPGKPSVARVVKESS